MGMSTALVSSGRKVFVVPPVSAVRKEVDLFIAADPTRLSSVGLGARSSLPNEFWYQRFAELGAARLLFDGHSLTSDKVYLKRRIKMENK
jgi:hypothetical protein